MMWSIEQKIGRHWTIRWLERWRVRSARRRPLGLHPRPGLERRRLFVDVSVISKHDAGTGIQRVVRGIATHLFASPPPGWELHAVGATRKRRYHVIPWPSGGEGGEEMTARPGDMFLGLDFALDTVRFHESQLADFKRRGGQLWFLIHDLLPMQRTDWFSDKVVVRFRKWFTVLATLADGFYCNSRQTETELIYALSERYGLNGGYQTQVLPMGWDLAGSQPSRGLPEHFDALLEQLRQRPSLLMVGTIEPRKGHGEVLDAFDTLWRDGLDYNLVLVGRPGWKTEALQAAIQQHPNNGARLFWLADASDEALLELYVACHGVIVASLAEGFGLPFIEALGHGKPVLARDLDVFRQHRAEGAQFFPFQIETSQLACTIRTWVESLPENGGIPPLAIPSWQDTAKALAASLAELRRHDGCE